MQRLESQSVESILSSPSAPEESAGQRTEARRTSRSTGPTRPQSTPVPASCPFSTPALLHGGLRFQSFVALDPVSAIRTDLAFPDRHSLFEGVDTVAARLERLCAMRGTDRNHNARFTEFNASKAMLNGRRAAPFDFRLLGYSQQLPFGHRHIGVIFQIRHVAPARLTANLPDKGADRPIG